MPSSRTLSLPFFVSSLLASLMLFFAGCGSTATSSSSDQDSIRTLTTSGNTQWVLAQWVSADGDKQKILRPAPTLVIGYQGRISGNAGVNDYVGNVSVSDDTLNWGSQLGATRRAGPPELMESESRYLDDLKATQRVTIRNNRLVFTGKKPLRMEFVRAQP